MAGQSACRIGDTGVGTCYLAGLHAVPMPYTTTFYEGSPIFYNGPGNTGIVLVGHHGHASCGHDTIATTGSQYTGVVGTSVHRVGDTGHIVGDPASTYIANSGSDTLNAE